MTQNSIDDKKCEDFLTHLEEYIVGELDDENESEFTAHLTTCDKCRHELLMAQTIDSVLDDLPKPTAPPEILREVMTYVRENPVSQGWLHRIFHFPTVLEYLRSQLLRVSVMVSLIGIMLFGIHQYHKFVEVEQAKRDFQYAMSKMQSAVRRTSLAVNDSFNSLKVDEAPRRALKPTKQISPVIQQGLGVINILTGSELYQNPEQNK